MICPPKRGSNTLKGCCGHEKYCKVSARLISADKVMKADSSCRLWGHINLFFFVCWSCKCSVQFLECVFCHACPSLDLHKALSWSGSSGREEGWYLHTGMLKGFGTYKHIIWNLWITNSNKFKCIAEILHGLEPLGGIIYRNVNLSRVAAVAQVLWSGYMNMLGKWLHYFVPDRLLKQWNLQLYDQLIFISHYFLWHFWAMWNGFHLLKQIQ